MSPSYFFHKKGRQGPHHHSRSTFCPGCVLSLYFFREFSEVAWQLQPGGEIIILAEGWSFPYTFAPYAACQSVVGCI